MFQLALATTIALTSIGAAQAQAPQPVAPSLGGPQLVGVCLLSQQAVLANSKIGLAATARLKMLAEQAQAEIDVERKPIFAEAQALDAQRASLSAVAVQQKQQALTQRMQAIEQKTQTRQREIELTRQKALRQIAGEAQPLIATVYKAHGCGLLVDRNAVLGGNMAGDLTASVVKALDDRITTISFDREQLPPPPASARP